MKKQIGIVVLCVAVLLILIGIGVRKEHQLDAQVIVTQTSPPIVVDSAADLANLTGLSDEDVVIVSGSADDEGGIFRYDSTSSATIDSRSVYNGPGSVGRFLRFARTDSFIRGADFGLVGDNSADDTIAMQAFLDAIAAADLPGILEGKTYKMTATLNVPANITLKGEGSGKTILDFSTATIGNLTSGICFLLEGNAFTSLGGVTGALSEADNSIVLSSAPSSVDRNDRIIIQDTDNTFFGGSDANRNAGEWALVDSVSGATITLQHGLLSDYPATVTVYHLDDPGCFHLEGFKVIAPNTGGVSQTFAFQVERCVDSTMKDVIGEDASNAVFRIQLCHNVIMEQCSALEDGSSDFGNDYGIVNMGTSHLTLIGGTYYGSRHAHTTGHGSDTPEIEPVIRFEKDIGVTFISPDASVVGAWDCHANAEHMWVQDCTIHGGMTIAGDHTHVIGCKIYGYVNRTLHYYDFHGFNHEVRNCYIVAYTQQASVGNIINVGGNGDAISEDSFEGGTFLVEGNRMEWTLTSDDPDFWGEFANRQFAHATDEINLIVRNNTIVAKGDFYGAGCKVQCIISTNEFTADTINDELDDVGHGLAVGDIIQLVNGAATPDLPAPLQENTRYYVIAVPSVDSFQISTKLGGTAIDITDPGTGTHEWSYQAQPFDNIIFEGNTTKHLSLITVSGSADTDHAKNVEIHNNFIDDGFANLGAIHVGDTMGTISVTENTILNSRYSAIYVNGVDNTQYARLIRITDNRTIDCRRDVTGENITVLQGDVVIIDDNTSRSRTYAVTVADGTGFARGERITGGTSGVQAIITEVSGNVLDVIFLDQSTNFTAAETITSDDGDSTTESSQAQLMDENINVNRYTDLWMYNNYNLDQETITLANGGTTHPITVSADFASGQYEAIDTSTGQEWNFGVNASDDYVIADITGATTPFLIEETAPTGFKINASGSVQHEVSTSVTLGVGVTTFAADGNLVVVTGDGGGNTIATITGELAYAGSTVTFLFVDGNVTITDNDAHAANSIDLSAAFTSADDTTLTVVYDGTSWYEKSRSAN